MVPDPANYLDGVLRRRVGRRPRGRVGGPGGGPEVDPVLGLWRLARRRGREEGLGGGCEHHFQRFEDVFGRKKSEKTEVVWRIEEDGEEDDRNGEEEMGEGRSKEMVEKTLLRCFYFFEIWIAVRISTSIFWRVGLD